eukprot:jgi/Mesvir1/9844/Mv22385-RA.2
MKRDAAHSQKVYQVGLSAANDRVADISRMRDAAEQRATEAEDELEKLQRAHAKTQGDLSANRSQVVADKVRLNELTQQAAQLSAQVEMAARQDAMCREELSRVWQQLSRLQAEHDALQALVDTSRLEADGAMERMLAAVRTQEEQQALVDREREELAAQERRLYNLLENKRKKKQRWKQQWKEANSTLEEKKREVIVLKSQLADVTRLGYEMEKLRTENGAANKRCAAMEAEMAAAQKQAALELEQANQRTAAAEQTIAGLRELADAEAVAKRAQAEELSQLLLQLADVKRAHLEEMEKAAQIARKELEKVAENTRLEVNQYKENLKLERQRVQKAERLLEEIKADSADYSERLKACQAASLAAQDEVKNAKAQLAMALASKESIRHEMQEELNLAREVVEHANRKQKIAQDLVESMRADVKALLAEAEAKRKELEAQVAELQGASVDREGAMREMQKALEEQRAAAAAAIAASEEYKAQIRNLDAVISEQIARGDSFQKQMVEAQALAVQLQERTKVAEAASKVAEEKSVVLAAANEEITVKAKAAEKAKQELEEKIQEEQTNGRLVQFTASLRAMEEWIAETGAVTRKRVEGDCKSEEAEAEAEASRDILCLASAWISELRKASEEPHKPPPPLPTLPPPPPENESMQGTLRGWASPPHTEEPPAAPVKKAEPEALVPPASDAATSSGAGVAPTNAGACVGVDLEEASHLLADASRALTMAQQMSHLASVATQRLAAMRKELRMEKEERASLESGHRVMVTALQDMRTDYETKVECVRADYETAMASIEARRKQLEQELEEMSRQVEAKEAASATLWDQLTEAKRCADKWSAEARGIVGRHTEHVKSKVAQYREMEAALQAEVRRIKVVVESPPDTYDAAAREEAAVALPDVQDKLQRVRARLSASIIDEKQALASVSEHEDASSSAADTTPAQLQQVFYEMEAANGELRDAVERAEEEAARARVETKALVREKEAVAATLAASEKALLMAQVQVAALREERVKMAEAERGLREQLDEAGKRLAQIPAMQADFRQLQACKAELEEKLANVTEAGEAAKAQCAQLGVELAKQAARISELQATLATTTAALEDSSKELAAVQEAHALLEESLSRTKEELAVNLDELAATKLSYDELMQSLTRTSRLAALWTSTVPANVDDGVACMVPQLSLQTLHVLISKFYCLKIIADAALPPTKVPATSSPKKVAQQQQQQRAASLCQFVYDAFMGKYGLRNIAELHLYSLIKAMEAFKSSSRRVAIFAALVGHDESNAPLPDEACRFFLLVLSRLFSATSGPAETEFASGYSRVNLAEAKQVLRYVLAKLEAEKVERLLSGLDSKWSMPSIVPGERPRTGAPGEVPPGSPGPSTPKHARKISAGPNPGDGKPGVRASEDASHLGTSDGTPPATPSLPSSFDGSQAGNGAPDAANVTIDMDVLMAEVIAFWRAQDAQVRGHHLALRNVQKRPPPMPCQTHRCVRQPLSAGRAGIPPPLSRSMSLCLVAGTHVRFLWLVLEPFSTTACLDPLPMPCHTK